MDINKAIHQFIQEKDKERKLVKNTIRHIRELDSKGAYGEHNTTATSLCKRITKIYIQKENQEFEFITRLIMTTNDEEKWQLIEQYDEQKASYLEHLADCLVRAYRTILFGENQLKTRHNRESKTEKDN